jgi:hypothetical protein
MTAFPPLPAPNYPEVYLTGISRSQYKELEVKDTNVDSVQMYLITGRSDRDSNIQTAV